MVLLKYKGVKILINYIEYNFNYISFNYGRYIIIYMNKNLCNKDRSRALHQVLKKARR